MEKQYYNYPYIIYDDGRCYSLRTNKFLTPQMTVKYPTYNLTLDGKKKKKKVHRLVAEMFLIQPDAEHNIVNHIDGDTHNFKLENLEWVTLSENSKHAHANGLIPKGEQIINKFTYNLPNEEWTLVEEWPNYVISSCGRIMNSKTKRILKPAISNNGYYEVNLWKNNKGTTKQIHQLVYSYFFQDFNLKGFVINHKDGNKLNNNKDNLEKVNYQENNLHASYVIKTNKTAKPVRQLDLNNNLIKIFPSIAQAQRETGISCISRAIKLHYKAGGYYWEFD